MKLMQGDCLELMKEIPDGIVDILLCDMPYGMTRNKWDAQIPFEPLWERYARICKKNAAIVLFAAEPFASMLITSKFCAYPLKSLDFWPIYGIIIR